MKLKLKLLALLLVLTLLLTGCGADDGVTDKEGGDTTELGGSFDSFGAALDELGAYDGYFEEESVDFEVNCLSGTENAYKLEGTTLTFTSVSEETVYSLSGTFKGNIVVDVGDGYKFDLELHGFSLVCDYTNPLTVKSADEFALKAKKDTENYIYDGREEVDSSDETVYSGAIHSEVDLEIGGKGKLTVVSASNNGIHTKDDLQIKNLTLLVSCVDNALKGNDGVEIESGNTTLIATGGDCIKTSNSDISEKGNQRGTVSIIGGTHNLYSARDGIDAAYDVTVDGGDTVLNIYTDKYSNYSTEVADTSSDENYIRFTSDSYSYSVKYYNSESDFLWVDAEYHSSVSGGMMNYYYYSYPKMPEYSKVQFFIYETDGQRGQETEYLVKTEYLTQNADADTFALTPSYNGLSCEWTNYSTKIQEGGFGGGPGGFGGGPGGFGGGPGGMGEGNTDKNDYSSKGIKAANEVLINGGEISVKSYDDAIHANADSTLENGNTPLGNVTVNGGNIILYSNDDGLHADGALSVNSGNVKVVNSYEGMEGETVNISGGSVSIRSLDDGINGTGTGVVVTVSGGSVYVYADGDGLDAGVEMNSTAKILFSGGDTVVISTSGGNSAIDTNSGYTQSGSARVVAVMNSRGMTSETAHGNAVGKTSRSELSLEQGEYLNIRINSKDTVSVKMSLDMNCFVLYLGSNDADISTSSSSSASFDENGVAWY